MGADVAGAVTLRGKWIALRMKLSSSMALGFLVTPEDAAKLEADAPIKDYRNGRDLTDRPRGVKIIDLFGLTAADVRSRYPATYQWVYERVKPERDQNARACYRENWWLFGEARREFARCLNWAFALHRHVETAKHRVFQFLEAEVLPDSKLIAVASDDALPLGILSSTVHVVWATGGWQLARCWQ